jgi:O-antigen/teichoic acid export membrane protein
LPKDIQLFYIQPAMTTLLRQFGKNVLSGWFALGIRFFLVFLVNPMLVHSLGNDGYGIWALIFSIINYMTILDLGLQGALVRFISKYLGLGDYKKINEILNTGFIVYSAVGLTVIIISLILSFLAIDLFNIPADYLREARLALLIIGLNTALNFIMYSWGGSLGAFHRFDISNGLMMAEDILRNGTIVILLMNGAGIVPLALTFLIGSGLRLGAATIILRKLYPPIRFSLKLASRGGFREIYNYSMMAFLISVVWLLIANSDNLIVGYFLDVSSVTIYAIAATFLTAIRSLIHTVSIPLRPLLSHYETLGEKERLSILYIKGTQFLYFVSFMIAGITVIYGDSFIQLWMGEGYEKSAEILKILIVPAAVYFPQLIGETLLYSIEKHKYILLLVAGEGVVKLALSIILIRYFGVVGVAIGTLVPQIIIYLFGYPVAIRRQIELSIKKYYWNIALAITAGLMLSLGLSIIAMKIIAPGNWPLFFMEVIIIAAMTLFAGYLLMNKNDKKNILNGIILKSRPE